MSGRIDLKSVRLKTAQKYSNWLLFYLFFQKQAPFSVPSQEELGPDEARKVLSEVDGFTDAQKERICWLIAHHHTYKDVTSLDHRILLEADFLVNSFEAHLAPEGIITFRDHVFRSESAISMLNDMWGLE